MDWFAIAKDLLLLIIGGLGWFVAFLQWKTARGSLKERLYDRRFEVYKSVQRFLTDILREGRVREEELPPFYDALQRAGFLFGQDVTDYLEKIRTNALALRKAELGMRHYGSEDQRLAAVREKTERLTWLIDQLGEWPKRLQPYLGFQR